MKRREERKMFCENCGNQISDKDMYCACCGAKINKRYAGPSQDQNYVTPEWEQIPPNDQWPSNQANPVRIKRLLRAVSEMFILLIFYAGYFLKKIFHYVFIW